MTGIRFNRAEIARKEAFGALFETDDAASVLEAHPKIIIQFPVRIRPNTPLTCISLGAYVFRKSYTRIFEFIKSKIEMKTLFNLTVQ